MNQIDAAFATGATLNDVVNAFVSKPQFTSQYPNFFSYEQFADKLIENVVGNTATAEAKAEAKADTVLALNMGLSRGDAIFNIFSNLAAKDPADPMWGQTATMLHNKVAVATYYTETLLGNTTDLATLQKVLANVTPTSDTSTDAAIAALLTPTSGQAIALTTGVDTPTATQAGATFVASLADNTNTFQSGDVLTATGAGNVLNADLGNSMKFAILATTNGIQTVNITAEANADPGPFSGGGATNNVADLPVQINALRMAGVTNWGDVQSRADVVIENIQLPTGNTNGITSDVTFTMRDTQPGNMTSVGTEGTAITSGPSFRAYFDPQALKRAGAINTTTVKIEAGNSAAHVSDADFAAKPQADLPYTRLQHHP